MADVQIAVGEHLGSPDDGRKPLGLGEDALDERRGVPEIRRQRLELAPGTRNPIRHVGAAIEVDRKHAMGVDRSQSFRRMQRAEKEPELFSDCDAVVVGQLSLGGLVAEKERRAEERPGVALVRRPDELWRGNRNREDRGKRRQHLQLSAHACDRDLAAREPKRPSLLDDPHRVVPAFAERPGGVDIEFRKLLGDEGSDERLVDHDVGVPLGHRPNLPC